MASCLTWASGGVVAELVGLLASMALAVASRGDRRWAGRPRRRLPARTWSRWPTWDAVWPIPGGTPGGRIAEAMTRAVSEDRSGLITRIPGLGSGHCRERIGQW